MFKKNCLVCGNIFETIYNRSKYCSLKCKNNSYKKICSYCGKNFLGFRKQIYCSKDCRIKDKDNILRKVKETNLKKFGTEYYTQTKEYSERYKKTCLEKYGVINLSQAIFVKEKRKNTYLEKYGVSNPSQSIIIKEKRKNVFLERYGVINPSQLNLIKDKKKNTNLERYGVDNPFKHEFFRKKIEKTNLKKFGTIYPTQNKDVQEKIKKTNLEKYGNECVFQSEMIKDKIKQKMLEKFGVKNISQSHILNVENYNKDYVKKNFIKDGFFLFDKFINYFGIYFSNGYLAKYRFGIIEPNESKKYVLQLEIYNYINSIYNKDNLLNVRDIIKPLELDIYLPDNYLAIEFDGIYFHSYGKYSSFELFNNFEKEDKNYHLNKTKLCEQKNIKLFHIFENEWIDPIKQEIWKSMIKNSLGLTENKIYARKCIIKDIDDIEVNNFLNQNHLQGSINSKINIGLFHNNELVSLMTFGKARFNKNYDYELLRFCNKINTNVVGSFSKLLKYFKKHYQGKIISYGNRRWVSINNNVYEKNGGKLLRISEPNYYYFKDNIKFLESRLKYQKHKLKNILENFDENLTETENMYNNGYRKIYDCGNLVYEL